MADLTEFEIDLLRDLNGEDRGLIWGAAMSEAIEGLHATGHLERKSTPAGISYGLSPLGRETARAAKEAEG